MQTISYRVVMDNELYHHGIKGQKWYVRRYQNEDGTLTEEGKKRYREDRKRVDKVGSVVRDVGIMAFGLSPIAWGIGKLGYAKGSAIVANLFGYGAMAGATLGLMAASPLNELGRTYVEEVLERNYREAKKKK